MSVEKRFFLRVFPPTVVPYLFRKLSKNNPFLVIHSRVHDGSVKSTSSIYVKEKKKERERNLGTVESVRAASSDKRSNSTVVCEINKS